MSRGSPSSRHKFLRLFQAVLYSYFTLFNFVAGAYERDGEHCRPVNDYHQRSGPAGGESNRRLATSSVVIPARQRGNTKLLVADREAQGWSNDLEHAEEWDEKDPAARFVPPPPSKNELLNGAEDLESFELRTEVEQLPAKWKKFETQFWGRGEIEDLRHAIRTRERADKIIEAAFNMSTVGGALIGERGRAAAILSFPVAVVGTILSLPVMIAGGIARRISKRRFKQLGERLRMKREEVNKRIEEFKFDEIGTRSDLLAGVKRPE